MENKIKNVVETEPFVKNVVIVKPKVFNAG